MRVDEFDYGLPEGAIAYEPPRERGGSRLLVVERGGRGLEDRMYADLPELLRAGDLVVLNDTRVMKSRVMGVANGKEIEIVVLEGHGKGDWRRHEVMYRGKLREGDIVVVGEHELLVEEVVGWWQM